MGCCSSDSLPVIPQSIKPDPDCNASITTVVRRIGVMWGRDYSVHEGTEFPSNSEQRRETMWMWFNKQTGQGTSAIIDLENFVRGTKEDKNKGMVLYSAAINDSPMFEQFQRVANTSRDNFFGFFSPATYNNPEDSFYLLHPQHTRKRDGAGSRRLVPEMITKWRLSTRACIRDGDLGRGADVFQKQDVILDVFSSGTVATTWEEIKFQVQDRDAEGKVIGSHTETRIEKDETEFVDRIEFRLILQGQMWAQWTAPGDTEYYGNQNIAISSPFFQTTINGGWFSPNEYITTTQPNVDPAFALLLSHLCNTEYSVPKIKEHLKPNTPAHPPHQTFSWGLQGGMQLQYNSRVQYNGTYNRSKW